MSRWQIVVAIMRICSDFCSPCCWRDNWWHWCLLGRWSTINCEWRHLFLITWGKALCASAVQIIRSFPSLSIHAMCFLIIKLVQSGHLSHSCILLLPFSLWHSVCAAIREAYIYIYREREHRSQAYNASANAWGLDPTSAAWSYACHACMQHTIYQRNTGIIKYCDTSTPLYLTTKL